MRKILGLVIILIVSLLTGCGQTASNEANNVDSQKKETGEPTVITVVAPKSPAIIPLLRMIENNSMGENTKIDLQLYNDMEAMMALASEGDYGILMVPAYTAANLNSKGVKVNLINVVTWGGMYLSTTDPNCNEWKDLEGKELYVPAKGSVPDIITQYFLKQNGLTIGENIEVVYSNHAEIAQLLSVGTIKYAIDVQPYVTANKKNIKEYQVISDFSEEWKRIQGEEYSMPATCMVANSEYLQENQELIGRFNQNISEAIQWTVDNPIAAGNLASVNLNVNAELVAEAMPGFCFNYQSTGESKNDIEKYFEILLELKPESIGGILPDKAFYYLKEN